MMKRLFWVLLGLSLAVTGCVKEEYDGCPCRSEDTGSSEGGDGPGSDDRTGITEGRECTAVFTFAPADLVVATKGYVTGTDDNVVDRIDVYAYDETGFPVAWHVLEDDEGLDLSAVSIKDTGSNGEIRTYLVMANLDYDTAYYLHWLDYLEISHNPEGVVPFSANFRQGRLVMGGTAKVVFGETQAVNVNLYRYMAKIEIGTITAAFPKQSDFDRDIYVKHIVFANSWDMMRILQRDVRYLTGEPTDIFGSYIRFSEAATFWNVTEGYSRPNVIDVDEHAYYDGTYSLEYFGGRGKLALDYSRLYNNNYKLEAHEINLSCPESVREASQHTFDVDAGKGQLCSTSYDVSPVLTVNKAFYTMPTYFQVKYTQPASWPGDRTHKMVIAVKINGNLYFYPISLESLQPNMVYRIKNISLKGEPSLYSNFFEWDLSKHDPDEPDAPRSRADVPDVQEWRVTGNVAEIDELVLYGVPSDGVSCAVQ